MARKILLYAMAIAYIAAGFYHFHNPAMYLKIIPHFLPFQRAINAVAGIAEIALGCLLFWRHTRNAAAWGLVALLIAVFPANVQMALDYAAQGHPQKWLAYARLPVQPLLIWWAVSYTDWYKYRRRKQAEASKIISSS